MQFHIEKMTFDELKSFREHNFVHRDILNQKKLWGKLAQGIMSINVEKLEGLL